MSDTTPSPGALPRPPLRLSLRLRKLRAMSIAEVVSRLQRSAYERVERARHPRASLVPWRDRLARALQPGLRRSRFWEADLLESRRGRRLPFPAFGERVRVQQLFADLYRGELEATRRVADRLCRHEFDFFGQTFAYGPTVDWHADPVSRRRWPGGFHADVPVNAGDIGFGDVKHVWELNRHQFLIDLGKAHFLSGERRYADETISLVMSWIDDNPPGTGVNWASPLEPAFRALSWIWAYHFCGGVLPADAHLRWLAGFHDHARFLHRHLEHYSSPFNHLVGEAAVLYMLGVVFPEFAESAAWRRRGRRVLESCLAEQFYADGGGAEQATFYHHATLGFYLLATLTGRGSGEEFSASTWRTIERALAFSMHLTQPDGLVPAIGDADDGKPIRFERLPFWDFRPYLAVGAVLFERADFKFVAGRFHEDALWLLGADARERFERLSAAPPAEVSRAFPDSGYYLLRSGWTAGHDFACFDCGEQCAGARHDDVPNALHGHADCLAITLMLGGRPIVVDAGFLCYNGPDAWQNHFRRTAAHNTARVDGRDQGRHLAKMAWSHTPRHRQEAWTVDEFGPRVVGSHDGFARNRDGVVHRRAVWLRPGYLVIHDEFVGTGDHEVELNFQFPAGVPALVEGNRIALGDRFELAWIGGRASTARVDEGGPTPEDGWIAASLGVRLAAPRLRLCAAFDPPHSSIVTLVVDRQRATLGRVATAEGVLTGALTVGGTREWVVAARAPVIRLPGLESDARVVMCLELPGGLSAAGAGATFLRVDQAQLGPFLNEA